MNINELKKEMLKNPDIYKNVLGERKIENLTENDFDFQGWLIPNLTLRQILEKLGFKYNENQIYIDCNNEILDKCPVILEDDGMGYGAKEFKIIDVENKEKTIFWI